MTSIHTMPVPNGCTIEQAWSFHCAGLLMNGVYGTSWVNIEVDEDEHRIIRVLSKHDTYGDMLDRHLELIRGGIEDDAAQAGSPPA